MPVKTSIFNPKIIIALVGGLIIGAVIGLAVNRIHPTSGGQNTVYVEPAHTSQQTPDSFFTDQSALVNGKVTAINKDNITVENWQKQTSSFKLGPTVFITNSTNASQTPSTDINKVPLNQFVIINLKKVNNEYVVSSVVVTPPVGSPPPLPSIKPYPSVK